MSNLDFTQEEIESVCLELGIPQDAFNDGKRRVIIDHWGNGNIVACPGSGKTTVLLAKILLLSRRMPFEDGSGICVLTHTNVAIGEIKSKLGSKANFLFKHPNFFGTIQSFVGQFLLKKVLFSHFKTTITVVDTEIFNKKLISLFWKLDNYRNPLHKKLFNTAYHKALTIKEIRDKCFGVVDNNDLSDHYKKAKQIHQDLKKKKFLSSKGILDYQKCKQINVEDLPQLYNKQNILKTILEKKHNCLMENISIRKEEILLKLWVDQIKEEIFNYEDGSKVAGRNTKTYKEYWKLKEKLYSSGIVSFRDAFELARAYVEKNSHIRDIVSKRFKVLFVDEMQDTQQHQLDLINSLFNNDVDKQYYGDPDQAIFSGISGGTLVWDCNKNGYPRLDISDSKRYGDKIAKCLFPFQKNLSELNGNTKVDSLKPRLILYNKTDSVIEMFYNEIVNNKLLDLDEYKYWNKESSPFNALGFVGKKDPKDTNKVTINSYTDNFSKETGKRKEQFGSLVAYFQKRPSIETLINGTTVYYNLFISASIELFRQNGEFLSKKEFLKKCEDGGYLLRFNYAVLLWIKEIEANTKSPEQIKEIFIKSWENKGYYFQDLSFRNGDLLPQEEFVKSSNKFEKNGLEIKFGTIHSVKGETHLATLLMETQNFNESESSYFLSPDNKKENQLFFCEKQNIDLNKRMYLRFKTTYVAMSRPTHLLCVALSKDKAKCTYCPKKNRENCNWKIIEE